MLSKLTETYRRVCIQMSCITSNCVFYRDINTPPLNLKDLFYKPFKRDNILKFYLLDQMKLFS